MQRKEEYESGDNRVRKRCFSINLGEKSVNFVSFTNNYAFQVA